MAVEVQYVEYTDLRVALNRSVEIWETILGRSANPRDTTQSYLGQIQHPDTGRLGNTGALVVPQESRYTDLLSPAELLLQRTDAQMDADGWFGDRTPE